MPVGHFADVPAGNGSIALRSMVHAARSLKRVALGRDDRLGRWLQGLAARAHANVATVALAAKLARFAPRASGDARRCADGSTAGGGRWAMMARHQAYRAAA